MNMILHTADPIGFTAALAHGAGKKRMGCSANSWFKPRLAIFCAED